MSDTSASASHQTVVTPSRPTNRNRHPKSCPQASTSQKRNNNNNKGPRRSNAQAVPSQPRQESALTKKFREAAQTDNGAVSDSGINAIMEKGIVTPPATPGQSVRKEPSAYVSDSAIGMHIDGSNKKKNNNKKRRGRRPTEIATNVLQSITPPQESIHTPPDDVLFGKPTPNKAYAGACFHASPAPDALPLPKFFSKSVPTSSNGPSLSKMLAEAEATGSPNATAGSPPLTAPLPRETPLDIFFKADKEEKARKALQNIVKNEILSPKPTATPSVENRTARNLTPPSAAIQTGLGSPFGGKTAGREEQDTDRDLLFSMDFDARKSAPRPTEEVVAGPRYRPLSFLGQDVESLVKRQEKAKELKAALMHQLASPKGLEFNEPMSPSPKPKPTSTSFPDSQGSSAPLSPTIHDRRPKSNNVGFAPAPRIRHFNQNRPVNPRHGQQHRNGKNQIYPPGQNLFQPTHTSTSSHIFNPERARMGESHIRGVLKLDAPISAN
ncbi:hypothetical protein DRE_02378 [Drechslerella stenobrocha 248]|uniref:Uncharacterized protein n=1 Tax=Drechslerella stenobrocha 248 TaxID=1043628 RepID=W7HXM2_9PEZI|nr:hypothetical protein DRE_02378 [Drechslerella stenobrocha 248]